ncbi:hypothetical protein O0L34_g3657 [Tuta absoluta]|nr:hypothetical protein O0L34_g3657 [Tuta absoluta]
MSPQTLEDLDGLEIEKVKLITVGDKDGKIYSLLCHALYGRISPGFPIWDIPPRDSMFVMETGPRAIAGDPCLIEYSHVEFLANMSFRPPLRLRNMQAGDPVLVVLPNSDLLDAMMRDPNVDLILVLGGANKDEGEWNYISASHFQVVTGRAEDVWTLYGRGSQPYQNQKP